MTAPWGGKQAWLVDVDHLTPWAIGVHNAAANNYRFSRANGPIVLGHGYSWRLKIKWNTGSDGFVQGWLDGRQLVNLPGSDDQGG
jgi:hypothetical protein